METVEVGLPKVRALLLAIAPPVATAATGSWVIVRVVIKIKKLPCPNRKVCITDIMFAIVSIEIIVTLHIARDIKPHFYADTDTLH
jgi:hypothetical protein